MNIERIVRQLTRDECVQITTIHARTQTHTHEFNKFSLRASINEADVELPEAVSELEYFDVIRTSEHASHLPRFSLLNIFLSSSPSRFYRWAVGGGGEGVS